MLPSAPDGGAQEEERARLHRRHGSGRLGLEHRQAGRAGYSGTDGRGAPEEAGAEEGDQD